MKKLLVKICGVTSESQARDISGLGPDMIGLMFADSSPRKISIENAKKIAGIAKDEGVKVVAVFQNQPVEEVLQAAALFECDYIQLHGEESVEFVRQMPVKVIKAVRLKPTAIETKKIMQEYKPAVDLFLCDRPEQGRGEVVDLKQVKELANKYPLLLAGGLTPENIESVLAEAGNDIIGVDVSGGVESSPGVKDLKKVANFINKVKKI